MGGDDTREVLSYYEGGAEIGRLEGAGELELIRTQEILSRRLPPPPAVVLDIGGGPGVYAAWLARQGYRTHLLDLSPRHVEQALAAAGASGHPLASAQAGDARRLPYTEGFADVAILLGPLYHLTERFERVEALREARRVLRPGGMIAAAAISRYASLLDGLRSGFLDDPRFSAIVARDLDSGQHRNMSRHPFWFTTAYFHEPGELAGEFEEAGLAHDETVAVEGPAWLLPDLPARLSDAARRDRLLEWLRRVQAEPSLLGVSAHLLAIGRRDG